MGTNAPPNKTRQNKQPKKLTSRQKNKMIEIIVVKHHQKQNFPINITMLIIKKK